MATPGTVETSASCAAEANTDAKESEPKSTALSLCAVCGDKNASPGPGGLINFSKRWIVSIQFSNSLISIRQQTNVIFECTIFLGQNKIFCCT